VNRDAVDGRALVRAHSSDALAIILLPVRVISLSAVPGPGVASPCAPKAVRGVELFICHAGEATAPILLGLYWPGPGVSSTPASRRLELPIEKDGDRCCATEVGEYAPGPGPSELVPARAALPPIEYDAAEKFVGLLFGRYASGPGVLLPTLRSVLADFGRPIEYAAELNLVAPNPSVLYCPGPGPALPTLGRAVLGRARPPKEYDDEVCLEG